MRPAFSRMQYLANTLAIGSGAYFTWAKYWAPPVDVYSAAGSRFESGAHASHVLAVPLLLFACGVIWQSHLLPKWRHRWQQKHGLTKTLSGLGMLWVLAPMSISGYLIQVSVDDSWRKGWVLTHWVASAVWSLGFFLHLPLFDRRSRTH